MTTDDVDGGAVYDNKAEPASASHVNGDLLQPSLAVYDNKAG